MRRVRRSTSEHTAHSVYLIHLESPYFHAQHYLGFTRDLKKREAQHEDGRGSPLLKAANGTGIAYGTVRVWECHCSLGWSGTWCDTEKRLKRLKNNRELCPVCNPVRQNVPIR